MNKNESFVAISDLHSNKKTIKKIENYIEAGYKVVILGDVTDRGPYGDGTYGVSMLLEIMELSLSGKVIYIPGNHDELLYGYATSYNDDVIYSYADILSYNGGLATISDIDILRENDPYKFKKLINWLGSLPLQVVLEVNGQKYCFAHALFNQKIYDTKPSFSLRDFRLLKDYNYNSDYAKILWFRKYEDTYNKDELPNKDSIMIIGHTPQDNVGEDDFNLIDNNGNTIRVINVDGGLANGHDNMFEYTSDDDNVKSCRFNNIEDRNSIKYKKSSNVDRSKSSKIKSGVIFNKINNLEDSIADLKNRVVEAMWQPSKRMIPYIMLATSLTIGSTAVYSNLKNSIYKEIAQSYSTNEDDIIYIIESGDTLSSIANSYNISLEELINYNNIDDPNDARIGDVLKIPNVNNIKFIEYTVGYGDTLSSIANNFDIDIDTIIFDNKIDNDEDVAVGTVLKIRVKNKLDSSISKTNKIKKLLKD